MPRIAVIVQARYGNLQTGRYPGKVLLPLPTGRTVLEEVLFRCQAIPGVNVVVAAIPDTPSSLPLIPFIRRAQSARNRHDRIDEWVRYLKWCQLRSQGHDPAIEEIVNLALTDCAGAREWDYGKTPIELVRGPEADVLARYALAAKVVNADIIIRVTADCPLISPEVCGDVLEALVESKGHFDYACNSMPQTWPHGYDCDVFTRDCLERANAAPDRDADGVNTWMRESPDVRRLNVRNPDGDFHHNRLTLDTPADYLAIYNEMLRRIWSWTGREEVRKVAA